MKKMICLVFMICFLTQLSTTYAQSNQKLDYPSNRNKPFVSEDVFYEQLDKKMYKEYNNAAYSVRKKILFKEVPDEEFSFLQKQPRVVGVKWCFKIHLFTLIAKFIFSLPFLKMK
ncbi:hypothetical protein bcere0013_47770 [Bacillus cereus BDRD-ST26]|nr:hypothetical protein bcere0013_47770 [Bacillus cereus BDRD-ST26]